LLRNFSIKGILLCPQFSFYQTSIMKSKSLIILILLLATCYVQAFAQSSKKTMLLSVSGNCEHCKERLETALDISGIQKAIYTPANHILKVSFDTAKVSTDSVLILIAKAGHDNDKYKASDATYSALPACCKYSRKK